MISARHWLMPPASLVSSAPVVFSSSADYLSSRRSHPKALGIIVAGERYIRQVAYLSIGRPICIRVYAYRELSLSLGA